MKKLFLIILALILITTYVIVARTSLFDQPTYSITDKKVLVLNTIAENYYIEPIIKNESIFLELDILTDEMSLDIIWDDKNNIAVMYDGESIIRMYADKNEVRINRNNAYEDEVLLIKDGQALISSKIIEQYSDYNYTYIKDMNRIIIDDAGQIKKEVSSNDRTRIRNEKSIWSNVNDIVDMGETLYVYKESKDWSFVRTSKGLFGYVENNNVSLINEFKNEIIEDEKDESIEVREKINLTWEYINKRTPDPSELEIVEGLDVISPTWFSIMNTKGDIKDKGRKDYVDWAHENKYDVWGLFSNGFDPEITSIILNDAVLREKVINNIIDMSIYYDLDGINLDFENVLLEDKDMLTQFVKELYPIAKQNNHVLSIDVTVKSGSSNWSLCYDRKELGKVVDYVILMAYDEYYAGRGESGSVASLPWVEYGISSLLEDVPNNKVLLGVPFYTRRWKEEYIDDSLKVTSKAFSMEKAEKILSDNNGTIIWDDKAKQYYGEYKEGNSVCKIWLEDENSMNERIKLLNRYNLRGIASWRRGFEKEDIWNLINKEMK